MENTMKNNIEKLTEISKIFDIEKFYTVSINRANVRVQGEYNSELIKRIKRKYPECKTVIDDNGYLNAIIDDTIEFCFT